MQIEIMQNSDRKTFLDWKTETESSFNFLQLQILLEYLPKKKKKTYFAYSLKAFSPIEPEEAQTYEVTSSSSIILHRYSVPVPDSN